MTLLARRCPLLAAPAHAACPDRACRADPAALLPREGPERALVLTLRFVAAAAETGDAACYDAGFAEAEAVFGPREGALVVARVAALLRAARREGVALVVLPPPCRSLSPDEADLLAALHATRAGLQAGDAGLLPRALRLAAADLAVVGLAPPDRAVPAEPHSLDRFETADWTGSELAALQFPAILS